MEYHSKNDEYFRIFRLPKETVTVKLFKNFNENSNQTMKYKI